MKTKTEPKKVSAPAVIEVPPFQDLILTVNGKPVVILRSDGVQFGSFYDEGIIRKAPILRHGYIGTTKQFIIQQKVCWQLLNNNVA
jgi:hypothetical protein